MIVAALIQDQIRIWWHQQLGHMHLCLVSTAYIYATGVPKVAIASDLEACPICVQSKLVRRVWNTAKSRPDGPLNATKESQLTLGSWFKILRSLSPQTHHSIDSIFRAFVV
jgi:hypothetical protein